MEIPTSALLRSNEKIAHSKITVVSVVGGGPYPQILACVRYPSSFNNMGAHYPKFEDPIAGGPAYPNLKLVGAGRVRIITYVRYP